MLQKLQHFNLTSIILFGVQSGFLALGAPSLSIEATAPFSLTSFALSLLLVFRTNTSYARWQEARSIWGGVTNRSRDIFRQVSHVTSAAGTYSARVAAQGFAQTHKHYHQQSTQLLLYVSRHVRLCMA